jgi:hypothetical protein
MVVDFETRWDKKEYTLSKLTTEQYIRDERFKAFGMCYKFYGEDKIRWVTHDKLPDFVDNVDWSTTAVLAHNAQFDVAILSWVYGAKPCFIFDSLSMGRALRGIEVGNSLAKLAEEYGLPPKGKAVHSTDGLAELTSEIEQELAEYCKHDVFLCEEIFKRLVVGYPAKELRLIDLTLKMFTNPVLDLDKEMLSEAIKEEAESRNALLQRLGIEESELASNPKFGEILQGLGVTPPTKISKTTGKSALALAKNDAHFQALLNSEREDIAQLCEARLAVKSTLERTRAQRFLDISHRGCLPVPLNYYGAHTGRWSASKGSGLNLQNLKRGSFLRKSIMAPDGYMLVVCDLSQIEPRVLAWLCDYDALLNIFSSGQDPYAQFGAQMFGIPGMTKDSHPDLRQSAKSALLGCFGPDTKVLTQRGWVPIVRVQATDTVWDGEAWVQHQGVVPQGEKEVLTALGISATTDHEILTEHGWAAWAEVLANRSLLKSALSLANLPVWGGEEKGQRFTPSCAALVDGKVLWIDITSNAEQQQGVIVALKEKLLKLGGRKKVTTLSARTERTETGFLTESAQSSLGVQTPKRKRTPIMEDAVLQYTQRGLKSVLSSCATLLGSMVGTNLRYSLIGSTTTKDTNPAIFGLLRAAKTEKTNAHTAHALLKNLSNASLPLKQKIQTYDIAYAGPRNRYTILTDAGPLIVHNCGYGLGWASFAAQLLTGFLGAPPTRYDKAFAKQLGVSVEYLNKFISWEENLKRMAEIPHTCTEQELIVHCVSAKKIIDKYREAAQPVKTFWEMCDALIKRSLLEGHEYTHKCLTFEKERIILPSKLALKYPGLSGKPDPLGRVQWSYGENEKKLYGGALTENIVQAVARCVMTDGMLRIQKKYPCVLTVHDEVVVLVPEGEAEQAREWVHAQMIVEPKYMPGIPLAADSDVAKRYGDAK